MLKLENQTVARLRDRLKARGERPSLFATDLTALAQSSVPSEVLMRFDALCEVMFLMASSDGKVSAEEEDTLRGAIRELSEGNVRTVHIRSMLEGAQGRLAKEGLEARIKAVAEKLTEDEASADAAFVLAAAVAFADDAIADEENEVLNSLADALGMDEEHAEHLLDELQAESEAVAPPS